MNLITPAEHPFAQFVRILGKGKRGARGLHIGLRGCQTFFCCPDVRPRRQQFGRQAHLQGGEHRVIRPVLSGQRRHHLRHAEQLRQGMRL